MKDIQLIIAGNDMGVGQEAKNAAQPYDHIHCVGLLQGRERLALLRDAHILVYPSTDEALGLSPFEGLLCGAPATVSDDCGCGQLIDKAQARLLVRYGDCKDIRKKRYNSFFMMRHFEPTWYKEEDVIYRITFPSQKSHNNILNCTKE